MYFDTGLRMWCIIKIRGIETELTRRHDVLMHWRLMHCLFHCKCLVPRSHHLGFHYHWQALRLPVLGLTCIEAKPSLLELSTHAMSPLLLLTEKEAMPPAVGLTCTQATTTPLELSKSYTIHHCDLQALTMIVKHRVTPLPPWLEGVQTIPFPVWLTGTKAMPSSRF